MIWANNILNSNHFYKLVWFLPFLMGLFIMLVVDPVLFFVNFSPYPLNSTPLIPKITAYLTFTGYLRFPRQTPSFSWDLNTWPLDLIASALMIEFSHFTLLMGKSFSFLGVYETINQKNGPLTMIINLCIVNQSGVYRWFLVEINQAMPHHCDIIFCARLKVGMWITLGSLPGWWRVCLRLEGLGREGRVPVLENGGEHTT